MPKNWAPLEANPDVLNKYARGLGLPEAIAFTDILSTEDWALEMVATRLGNRRSQSE